MHVRTISTLAASAAALLALTAAAGAAPKVAVFQFELYDTSTEGDIQGARADQAQRIDEMTRQVKDFVKDKEKMEIVDVSPAQKDIDGQVLRTCGPCPARIANGLGADYSLMGYVQKVSNLILNVNIEIRDVKTGEVVRKGSADIRGNTSETWTHGASYLMRHTIFKEPLPGQ